MNARTIDYNKCIGCGLCVSDCVNQYLRFDTDDSGKKKISVQKRGRCLNCGHCNAICPQNAISGGDIEDNKNKDDILLSLMSKKRTVRKFIKNSAIPKDCLDKILFAAQTAPTDRNRKSSRIIFIKELLPVVYNKALDYLVDEVKKTGTINPLYVPTMRLNDNRNEVLWNAEYLVLFIGSPNNTIDSAIAAERMQLEAFQLGVGTAYRGDMLKAINNQNELRDILEIRKNEEVLVAFAMGTTEIKYQRGAVKNNHKLIFK